jgi:hypothetical protein
VVDLRRPYEVTRDGRVPEFDGLTWRHVPPEHAEWDETPYLPGADLARYLADRYADLARTGTLGLAEAVGVIAEGVNSPVLVHCVAGKDRTGIVCGLTLSVLGVSDEDVAADYARTARAAERFAAWVAETMPERGPLPAAWLASPAETMLLFLAELRAGYGSVEGYLRAAGVTPAQLDALKDHLLE